MKLHRRHLAVALALGGVVSLIQASFPAAAPAFVFIAASPQPPSFASVSRAPEVPHPLLSLSTVKELPSTSIPPSTPSQTKHHTVRRHRTKKAHPHRQHRHRKHAKIRGRIRRTEHSTAAQMPVPQLSVTILPVQQPTRRPVVDINRASLGELQRLPGIDPILAQHILTLRKAGGGFDDIDDLLDVAGMTSAKLRHLESMLKL